MNDYLQKSKDELIELLKSKERLLETFKQEREEEEHLKFAWTGNLGHWYWDVQNNHVTFNSRKATNLGYTKNEIPENCDYQFFTEKLHPDDYEPVMQNMRDHLTGKTNAYEVEYRIKAKDGTWKWYYDRGKITKRSETGKPLFLAGIVFDISQRKSWEEKQSILIKSLSEQLHLQESLFSVIFHDLRTPISNMIGFSDLLVDSLNSANNEEIEEFALTIGHSANQALEITEGLLDWIKAKSFLKRAPDQVNLASLANQLYHEFDQDIKAKEIQFVNRVQPGSFIATNKPILKIALRNFLSNAIKFSYRGGTIEIDYKDNVLSIKDSGVGMTPNKIEHIFNNQAESATGTAGEKGSGIGLILVHDLLEKTNLQLAIESNPNQGTKVSLQVTEK